MILLLLIDEAVILVKSNLQVDRMLKYLFKKGYVKHCVLWSAIFIVLCFAATPPKTKDCTVVAYDSTS